MTFIRNLPGPLLIFLGALSLSFGGLIVKSFEGATLWQILFWRSVFFFYYGPNFFIDNLQKHIDTLKTEYNEKFDYIEQAVSSLDNTTKVVFIESNLNKLTTEVSEMKSDLQKPSSISSDVLDEKFKLLETRLDNLYQQLVETNNNRELEQALQGVLGLSLKFIIYYKFD